MVKLNLGLVVFLVFLLVCIKLIFNLWCYDEQHDMIGNRVYSQDEIIAMSKEEYHELCKKEGHFVIGVESINRDRYDNLTASEKAKKQTYEFWVRVYISAIIFLTPFYIHMLYRVARGIGNILFDKKT